MPRTEAAAQGVSDAFGYWLSQHPVSVPESIEGAVEKAVTKWLDFHSDQLVTAIAEAMSKRKPPGGRTYPDDDYQDPDFI